VPTLRRTARSATSIGEVTIPGGAPLLLGLSGNGGSLDLACGLGSHRCLGASLARLETRVVISTASAMLPDLVLVERNHRCWTCCRSAHPAAS
jgi:cytochrome P450